MQQDNKIFSFTFTREEAIEYYTYLLSSTKANRLKQIFFIFSVPLLLVLTYIFFKIRNIFISIVFAVAAIIWMMIIAPRFWHAYTSNNIGEKFLINNNLTVFTEVKVIIENNRMIIDGKEYLLNDNVRVVKTRLLTIFFFPGQPVALPNRILDNINK